MTGQRCARVRLWRWRRNSLKRRSDVIEAWVVLVGWVMVLVGGVIAGLVAVAAVERSVERQRAERREVVAVLVEDAADRSLARTTTTDHRVWTPVRWTAADGSTHTDEARVEPRTRAGSTVTVWTDRDGRVTAEPLTEGETRLHAVSGGALAAAGTGGLVWGAVRAARWGLARHRMEQWAAEWERIDTRWRRPTG